MSRTRGGPLVAAAVAAIAVVLPAAGRASVVAQDTRPQALAAYGGVLVSEFDERSRRYRLMARRGARVARMAVRPSEQPFEVDLGPGIREPVVAVYSRCDRRDCDLLRYSFRARRARRLAFAASLRARRWRPPSGATGSPSPPSPTPSAGGTTAS